MFNKLGMIAGSGELPKRVVEHCQKNGIELFAISIKGFGDKSLYESNNIKFIELSFGQVGKAIKFFKTNNISKIVFAGAVKKPSFYKIRIDFKGLFLLKNILKNKFLGDNSVLETVIIFFEKRNIEILEIDKVIDNIKFEKGFNSNSTTELNNDFLDNVNLGKGVLEKLSNLDIGQSIAIQQKNVIGIECVEGTKELINRCGIIKYKNGDRPILIKMKKIDQTRKADLPAVGPDTIEQLHEAGFSGIVVDYKNCLAVSLEKTIDLSNKYNIFIYGI